MLLGARFQRRASKLIEEGRRTLANGDLHQASKRLQETECLVNV